MSLLSNSNLTASCAPKRKISQTDADDSPLDRRNKIPKPDDVEPTAPAQQTESLDPLYDIPYLPAAAPAPVPNVVMASSNNQAANNLPCYYTSAASGAPLPVQDRLQRAGQQQNTSNKVINDLTTHLASQVMFLYGGDFAAKLDVICDSFVVTCSANPKSQEIVMCTCNEQAYYVYMYLSQRLAAHNTAHHSSVSSTIWFRAASDTSQVFGHNMIVCTYDTFSEGNLTDYGGGAPTKIVCLEADLLFFGTTGSSSSSTEQYVVESLGETRAASFKPTATAAAFRKGVLGWLNKSIYFETIGFVIVSSIAHRDVTARIQVCFSPSSFFRFALLFILSLSL